MPSDVMILDDLDLDALERAFAVNHSPTIAVEIARRRGGEKSLNTELAWLFTDDTWGDLRGVLVPIAREVFSEAFMVGAQLATQQRPGKRGLKSDEDGVQQALAFMRGRKAPISLYDAALDAFMSWLPFGFDAVLLAAEDVIAMYVDAWWQQFRQSTQDALRRIIARAYSESLTMPEIIEQVEPLFGAGRARAIAVTETTRLLGLGAQETYRQAGFTEWAWRTVRDTRVDPVCEELGRRADLEGETFPMTTPFIPAHVNCRCWPVPMGNPVAPSGLIPGVPPMRI